MISGLNSVITLSVPTKEVMVQATVSVLDLEREMCYTVPYPIFSLESSPVQVGGTDATPPFWESRNGRHMLYAADQLVLDICNPELRENALHEFSKVLVCFARREIFHDLTLLLWPSVGTIPALPHSNYHNYTSAVGSGKKAMQELKNYWSVTFHFNILNRGGIYANENLSSQYSSAVSSSLDVANTSLLTSVNHSLKPSNDACSKINSMFIPCCEDLIEPKSDHSHNIVEITNNTGKYLLDENLVDKPSCSTPRKRPNDIPSIESIEANGDAKEQQHLIRASSVYAEAVSDSRSPLSAVN
ncbi:hypothetical protein HID58_086676 [Brassica napus]|uniref:Uncharacterized protein n=2 Tax=Brassica napus TaxID=3708 RepID=A0ABQ7XR69_BRANA|nr:hypothetical protein HID58_086676 [Brassica napus]